MPNDHSHNFAGHNDKPSLIKVIATLEGGGRLGLITAYLVDELCRRSGKKFHELFDDLYAVSINALLAACLWPLEKTDKAVFESDEYKNYFLNHGDFALRHGWLYQKIFRDLTSVVSNCNVSGLEQMIEEKFGNLKLSDFKDGLNIYVWHPKTHQKLFLSSDNAKKDLSSNYYMKDLLRSAISFPSMIRTSPIRSMSGELKHFFDMASPGTCPSLLGARAARKKYGSETIITPVVFGCGRFNLSKAEEQSEQYGIMGFKQTIQSTNTTEVLNDREAVADITPFSIIMDVILDEGAHTFSPIEKVIPIAERAVLENLPIIHRLRLMYEWLDQEKHADVHAAPRHNAG